MESAKSTAHHEILQQDDLQTAHHNNQFSAKQGFSKKLIFMVSLLIILAIIVVSAFVSNLSARKREMESDSLAIDSASTIWSVCSLTQHPPSCVKSLSSLIDLGDTGPKIQFMNPSGVLILSLRVAVDELSNITLVVAETLLNSSGYSNESPNLSALRGCAHLLNESLSRLNRSLNTMSPYTNEERLRNRKVIGDLMKWVGEAAGELDGCWNMLNTVGDSGRPPAPARILRKRVYDIKIGVTNIMDTIDNLKGIREKFRIQSRRTLESLLRKASSFLPLSLFCTQYVVLIILLYVIVRN